MKLRIYKTHTHIYIYESVSHSVESDSLWPHGLYSPCNSPGQNTGVGSFSLLQGIFPAQGSNPGLPHCRQILYQLSHQGPVAGSTYLLSWAGGRRWTRKEPVGWVAWLHCRLQGQGENLPAWLGLLPGSHRGSRGGSPPPRPQRFSFLRRLAQKWKPGDRRAKKDLVVKRLVA